MDDEETDSDDTKGLTTDAALKYLISELQPMVDSDKWTKKRWKNLFFKSMSSNTENSLFPWPNMCLTALYFATLFVLGVNLQDPWLITESFVIAMFLGLNVVVNLGNLYLTETEILSRLNDVIERLEIEIDKGISWTPENYPHLHTPLSASVVLQWTIRDGHKVNLPWALLVKNDLIYLKPGQVAPGKKKYDCQIRVSLYYILT